mmetsp:Transcript_21501/g.53111  ORF Transcript_21501/g.53111 Transcript_21501/m.53111 type:complete len:340 (-) Transcript_21501:366-1385(-)
MGVTGKVFSGLTNQNTSSQTKTDTSKDAPSNSFTSLEQKGNNDCSKDDFNDTGNNGSLVKRHKEFFLVGVGVLDSDKEVTNDTGNDSRSCNPKGKHNADDIVLGQDQGSNNGTHKGFKEIGSHSSNITNVVTNIVSNDCRIAWIVFGNVHFDLANQVSSNIGSLGVNSSSHTSKESNRRGSKSKGGKGIRRIHQNIRLGCIIVSQSHKVVHERDTQQTETDDHESHDGTSGKGHLESSVKSSLIGSLCGLDVGIRGNDHAVPTSRSTEKGTHDKANRIPHAVQLFSRDRVKKVKAKETNGSHHNVSNQITVLGHQEGSSTALDLVRNGIHEITSTGHSV